MLLFIILVLVIIFGAYYSSNQKNKTKICKHCKSEINKKATVCPYCQSSLGMSVNGCLGAFVFLIIVGALFIWVLKPISNGYNKRQEQKDVQERASQYSETDYKEMCKSVSYEDIARDSNARKGEYFIFTGEVAQELDNGIYRLTVDEDRNDIVFEFNGDTRFLEGDKVTVWGESAGFVEGQTLFGANVKAPKINAVYVSIEDKEESN